MEKYGTRMRMINFRVQWAIFLSGGLLATEGVLASTLVDFKKAPQ